MNATSRTPVRRDVRLCLLCSARPATVVGVFEPNEPWLFCAAPPQAGKRRVIVYELCQACLVSGNVAERVEEAILARGGA